MAIYSLVVEVVIDVIAAVVSDSAVEIGRAHV